MFQAYQIKVSEVQKRKLEKAIKNKRRIRPVAIKLKHKELTGDDTLLLTKNQLKKVTRAKRFRRGVILKLSKRQVQANMRTEGGFLGMLAGLASRFLPSLLGGLATGIISAGVEKAVKGHGIFLCKQGHRYRVEPVEGNGLYLSPHPELDGVNGDGLYLGSPDGSIQDGKGLLLGANSPFKNIPILGLLL